MAFSQALAEAHIQKLELKYKVEVRFVTGGDGEALISSRSVYIPVLDTPERYLAALHEFGHIVCKEAIKWHKKYMQSETLADEWMCETAAWAWAIREHYPILVPKKAWAFVTRCLRTYLVQ